MNCKCDNEKCLGSILLHEKELYELLDIKVKLSLKYGDVDFVLKRSSSSGELFTKFYDLHVISK